MTPHYKMIEVGGKKLAVFYPQYKDDDGYKIIDPENRFPIELKNHDEYMSFLETLIEREQEIKDGLTTLADLIEEMDMLARGPKGDTRYMWVKYADDEQGNGMSDDPTGKKYIGFAFNKDEETPSDEPSDYKFVKYVADYEGLEIGGRNYFSYDSVDYSRKTINKIGNYGFEVTTNDLNIAWFRLNSFDLNVGETYTISFEIKIIDQNQRWNADKGHYLYLNEHRRAYHNEPTLIVGEFVKVYSTFVMPEITSDWVHIYIDNPTGVEIRNVQIEKGTVPTDWSPAPEDIYALIDNVDKAHVGLSNVQNYGIASQSQAENGTSNSAYMTPLRTKQAIEKLSPSYVIDTEIGDDYILKKYSDGTFELKGHVKRTESLTTEINNMYRTVNLSTELTPIIDDSYKLIYSNAWIMDGSTNSFLVMTSVSNPLNEKSIRYRIMGNNISPTEDVEFTIGYEAYGTWS